MVVAAAKQRLRRQYGPKKELGLEHELASVAAVVEENFHIFLLARRMADADLPSAVEVSSA